MQLDLEPIPDALKLDLEPLETRPGYEPASVSMADVGISGGEFENVQTVDLPPFGKPGTLTRGISKGLTGLVHTATTPEGMALAPGLMVPVAGPILGTALSAQAIWQASLKAEEAISKKDPEAAGEALVLGGAGTLGTVGLLPRTSRQVRLTGTSPDIITRRWKTASGWQEMTGPRDVVERAMAADMAAKAPPEQPASAEEIKVRVRQPETTGPQRTRENIVSEPEAPTAAAPSPIEAPATSQPNPPASPAPVPAPKAPRTRANIAAQILKRYGVESEVADRFGNWVASKLPEAVGETFRNRVLELFQTSGLVSERSMALFHEDAAHYQGMGLTPEQIAEHVQNAKIANQKAVGEVRAQNRKAMNQLESGELTDADAERLFLEPERARTEKELAAAEATPAPVRPEEEAELRADLEQETAEPPPAPIEEPKPAPLAPVSGVEALPATENGGRIAIILPNGKAVVGGRIHADTWNRAIEQGVATDSELMDGTAGFVRPDGTAWGVNGKPLPKVKEVFIVGRETPKPPALPSQRPPEPKPAPEAAEAPKPSPEPTPAAAETGMEAPELSEAEKVQKYSAGMVQSAGQYIKRSIDSGATAKEAALQWAKEIGSGLMDTPDEVYRKERGGLYTSTYVKGVFGTKEGVAVNAKQYLKAIDEARRSAIQRFKPKTQAPAQAAAKVEEQVKTVAKTEGQRSAKDVKSELVSRLEDAVSKATHNENEIFRNYHVKAPATFSDKFELLDHPQQRGGWGTTPLDFWLNQKGKNGIANRDTALGGKFMVDAMQRAGVDKITIDIPGDGTFTVFNSKQALGGLLERAKKISTSTASTKGYGETKPSHAQGQQWLKEAETKPPSEPGPGMADLGAATPASIPSAPSNFRHWFDTHIGKPFVKIAPSIKRLWNSSEIRQNMATLRDWVDNSARLFARSQANDVRQPLRRVAGKDFKVADNALSMVVEAKGNPEALDAMRVKLIDSTKADPWWRKQALDALDYAVYHWDELSKVAEDYNKITNAQVGIENNSSIPTLKREGYVPHRQEIDELDLLTQGGQGQSTFFEKPRVHDTFADSIAAGVDPKSLSATDLLEHRLGSGMRLVNSKKWLETLRGTNDPTTGAPIARNLKPLKRADGSVVMVPPDGYVSEMIGPHSIAIQKGYEGTFSALTDPSFFTKSMAGRALMQANAAGKSIALMIDTFHLGRLAFWDSLIKGLGIRTFKAPFPTYQRGVTLLDFTEPQIREMAAKGEIPQRWLKELTENKRRLNLAVRTGYNVGRVHDALYQDLIHSVKGIGTFNKWLFDQFQRGAMADSWLLEFERAKRASPNVPEAELARQVSKDLNTRFGNLGRQGWFKSKSAQDAARLIALAPQWNEGLIKSELGAVREAGQFVKDAATGRRLYAGTLLRTVGAMALMQFTANQILNQATRGKFTWENPEEGWGSKLSAWIPDLAGNGPGFFLHPLGLAAETTHLLTNLYERSGGDTSKTITDYARSRSSAVMRPILTLLTRTDFLGRHIKPGTLWGEVVKSAVPTPIAASAATAAVKQGITGTHSEQFPGQYQKQAMASLGVRTEGAPSPEQRISRLAADWKQQKGIEANVAFLGSGDYQPLIQAARMGNQSAAQAEIKKLREKYTDQQIQKHFTRWQKAPFTGSHARENEFRATLSPEQEMAYLKARDDRERIASAISQLLR